MDLTTLLLLLACSLCSTAIAKNPVALNNEAVQLFVGGHVQAAHDILLRLSQNTRSSTTTTSTISSVVHKNLGWIQTVLQHSTEAALTWQHVHTTFLHQIFAGGDQPARAADDAQYQSLFLKSPFGRQLCNHPSFAFELAKTSTRHGSEATTLASSSVSPEDRGRNLYLDLIRRSITGFTGKNSLASQLHKELGGRGINCSASRNYLEGVCEARWDLYYASGGDTTGYVCLPNAASCPATGNQAVHLLHVELIMADLLKKQVKGDFLEAGVFRGGFLVMMQAVLASFGIEDRKVIAADSFEGIPEGVELGVSMIDAVKNGIDPSIVYEEEDWTNRFVADESWLYENLRKHGLSSDNVELLKGFFNESLLTIASDRKFAMIHLDSDSYEAISESLSSLYPKVSSGGYIIIDDMHLPGVQRAVKEFLVTVNGEVSPLWPVPSDYVHACGVNANIPTPAELDAGAVMELNGTGNHDADVVPRTNILHPQQQHLALSFPPYVGYFMKL
jgi:hypothetical protein